MLYANWNFIIIIIIVIFLVKYTWFTMLCYLLLYSKVTQLYTYRHSFFSCSFPLWFITRYWIYSPVLYSRTLLFIHPIYTSLPLLIPNSQSFPPPPSSPLATTTLFSMSVSLFLFCRQVHLCHILFYFLICVCLFFNLFYFIYFIFGCVGSLLVHAGFL